MKRVILVCGAAVLALAACQKKTETAATGESPTAAATAPAASAGPMTPPPRKAGLWEQKVAMAEMTQSTKICLDDATDKQMAWWGSQAAKSTCSEQKINGRLGGGWDFHSVCSIPGGGTTTSDGTATGDFNSHYTVNVTSTTTGGPMPQANGVHKISIEATWQGACPADMKPGDMSLPGGMKINMNDAMSGKGPMGGHAPSAAQIAKMRAQAKAMIEAQQKGN